MTLVEAKKNLIIDNCFYVGYLKKSHGNKGQLSSKIFFDFENINEESILVEINKYLVPFFIDYNNSNFDSIPQIIKFTDINSIEEAKSFLGTKLFLPKNSIPNIEDFLIDWENFVIGFSIIDKNIGNIGMIDNFIDDNKNPLFSIVYKEINQLIPLNSIIINKSDYENKIIYCEIPENILDI